MKDETSAYDEDQIVVAPEEKGLQKTVVTEEEKVIEDGAADEAA